MIHPARLGADGFTLIELTMVMVIFAVTLTLLMPRFVGHDREELRRGVRAMAGALELAAEEAALGGRSLRLTLDMEAQRLHLDVSDGADAYTPLRDGLLQDLLVRAPVRVLGVAVGSGTYKRNGQVQVVFPPDGVTETIRLVLGVDQGASCELVFDPILEKVSLPPGETCG